MGGGAAAGKLPEGSGEAGEEGPRGCWVGMGLEAGVHEVVVAGRQQTSSMGLRLPSLSRVVGQSAQLHAVRGGRWKIPVSIRHHSTICFQTIRQYLK